MTKTTFNRQIADCISAAFHDQDWRYRFDEEKGLFRTGVAIDGPIQDIQIVIDVKNDEFVVYGMSPVRADRKNVGMMTRMAEFLHRANYGLKNGCFEMDFRDGEIRYRSYVDCDGIIPSKMVIVDTLHVCATMFERYAPGITGIIFTDMTAADAIERCENPKALMQRLMDSIGEADEAEEASGSSSEDSADGSGEMGADTETDDIEAMFERLMARLSSGTTEDTTAS